jgi:putative phosphoribosyl transferase
MCWQSHQVPPGHSSCRRSLQAVQIMMPILAWPPAARVGACRENPRAADFPQFARPRMRRARPGPPLIGQFEEVAGMDKQPAEAATEEIRLPFPDRRSAGRALAAALRRRFTGPEGLLTLPHPLVLALPRGGVAVAAEVARDLGAPLDVLVTRKIGYPLQPELGVGALAEGGDPVYDGAILRELGISEAQLAGVVARERAELERRVAVYRGGRPPPQVRGKSVILTDDGLATGVTARAALRALRAGEAARIVLAVPVGSPVSMAAIAAEADDVVALALPPGFHAVGEWYSAFGQLTDADVLALLSDAVGAPSAEPPA